MGTQSAGRRIWHLALAVSLAGCTLAVAGCAHGRRDAVEPGVARGGGAGPALWPLPPPYREISSGYGYRGSHLHQGADILAPKGVKAVATAEGVVSLSGEQRGYGNIVVVDHARGIQTAYAHLNKRTVKTGQRVKRGQVVGLVGQTGNATRPHLHYEVRVDGRAVDPRPYLP